MYSASSEAGSTAQLAAGMAKPRRPVGRSPRARRAARRLLQTSTANDPPNGQSTYSSSQTERFLFVPCEHCPHDWHTNVQCFKRIQLSTTAWNRLRHFDARDTLVEQLPTARAQPIIRQENPPAPANAANALPGTFGMVRPPTFKQRKEHLLHRRMSSQWVRRRRTMTGMMATTATSSYCDDASLLVTVAVSQSTASQPRSM
jgi:hypothetical protein